MQYLRLLLYPFSLLYGLIISLRNKAYDAGALKSKKYPIPVICVGNLAVGGAGKSPMTEYIIRLLKDQKKLAVLSRGYGRKTKGFRWVKWGDTSAEAGDEPLQFAQKFADISVAVSEKRVTGIDILQNDHDVVILDDAFQHRAVRAGLNILLFDYTRLLEPFVVFPAGNFREPFSGRRRADMIVVTKTSEHLSQAERDAIRRRVKPYSHQALFFSYLNYGNLTPVFPDENKLPIMATSEVGDKEILLITGIANPYPLVEKLKSLSSCVKHYDYPDHHPFTKKNIAKLVREFQAGGNGKIIVTTEKDAQRLRDPELAELLKTFPVYYLPVTASIHQPDADKFNRLIIDYVG